MQRLIIIVALVSGLSGFAADPPATPTTTNKLGAGVLAPLLDAPRTNARPVTLQPPATARPKFELHDGDRVVFLGDAFMEREQLESYIETMLTLRYPTNKVIFRNLGWSADTPLGVSRAAFDPPEKGFDRVKEHIAAVKPTVVFLSHAMTASFNGINALPKFEGEMRTLIRSEERRVGKECRSR